jgi:hypothetical protein
VTKKISPAYADNMQKTFEFDILAFIQKKFNAGIRRPGDAFDEKKNQGSKISYKCTFKDKYACQ